MICYILFFSLFAIFNITLKFLIMVGPLYMHLTVVSMSNICYYIILDQYFYVFNVYHPLYIYVWKVRLSFIQIMCFTKYTEIADAVDMMGLLRLLHWRHCALLSCTLETCDFISDFPHKICQKLSTLSLYVHDATTTTRNIENAFYIIIIRDARSLQNIFV